MDAQYFEEPTEFKPERFEKGSNLYKEGIWYPLDDNSGTKVGSIVAKVTVAKILSKYDIEIISTKELDLDQTAFTMAPTNEIRVKMILRECCTRL